MSVVFKQTYSSELSQPEIFNNLLKYSEFHKAIFENSDVNKKFTLIIDQEIVKYRIYTEMRGLIPIPIIKKLKRINTDVFAKLEFIKSESNLTIVEFKVIKTFAAAYDEFFSFLMTIFILGFAISMFIIGLYSLGFTLLPLSFFFFFFILKRRKVRGIYKQEYIDLVNRIISGE